MKALKEVTQWDVAYRQPNHTYLLDNNKVVGYKPWHDGETVFFDRPFKLDRRYRKFVEVEIEIDKY